MVRRCRLCEGDLELFLDFGQMPIANGWLDPPQFDAEPRFPLRVAQCQRCGGVQLVEVVPAEAMFNDHYAFFSSTSRGMAEHFERFATDVRAQWLGPDPFVVEIGCNDGVMLRHFKSAGVRHLGIEPSGNVAAAARRAGLQVMERFFDAELAEEIRAEHGPADVLVGANVVCHIADLAQVFEGAHVLLGPRGVFMFEDPYLGDIVSRTAFDQIYDEHIHYFSLEAVTHLAARHGLQVIDALPQTVHGGEMRFVLGHVGAHPISGRVTALAAREASQGLGEIETLQGFARAVGQSRDALRALLDRLAREGRRVAGYGATSKSTTVINYCGLGPQHIEFITDITPTKIGRYSPGGHIPVRDHDAFVSHPPEYAVLFAWNHAAEIRAKEGAFEARGGRWITYVPRVEVS